VLESVRRLEDEVKELRERLDETREIERPPRVR
jgi:hypothetical protein